MAVGIAKVEASAAGRPVGAPLDRNALRGNLRLPGGKFVRRDRERHMQRSTPVMRRNGSARQVDGLQGLAAAKQQQHALAAHVIGAEAAVAAHPPAPEHPLLESPPPPPLAPPPPPPPH